MPQVTKNLSTVAVEYTPRASTITITKAEHNLIIDMQAHYAQMVKFILGQYSLDLYDAEQVIDTVIEAHAVNIKGSGNEDTAEVDEDDQEIDWSRVPKGTVVYVQDYPDNEWYLSEFIRYSPNESYPFTCKTFEDDEDTRWKYAKFGNT